MKRLFTILAMAALVATASLATSCEGPMGPPGRDGYDGRDGDVLKEVIDGIYVNPDGWQELWFGSNFDCMYADIYMPELTSGIISNGIFFTYFKYEDPDTFTLVQEGEGLTFFEGNWSYTINCEYSAGNMRITIRTSDYEPYYPENTLNFRTVILY